MAESAGFLPGDVLVSVDGRDISTWGHQQFHMLNQAMKGNAITVSARHPEQGERDITLDFSTYDQRRINGSPITSQVGLWPPAPPATVTGVVPGSPAESAGLQEGDLVLSVDGEAVTDWVDMATRISQSPGQTLALSVERGGQPLEISVVPNTIEVEGQQYGQVGLYRPPPESMALRFGPLQSVWQALDYNWHMTVITLRSIGRMLTAQMSSENLSGPITIARIAGRTVESGFSDFMKFLAIISISLGLLNLLPIPVLDGGHLMYFLYEAVTGREPSERVMIWGQQIGIAMIIMLMVLAFYNDILRLVQA